MFTPFHLDLRADETWKADLSWHYQNAAADIEEREVEEATFQVVSAVDGKYQLKVVRKPVKTILAGVEVGLPRSVKEVDSEASAAQDRLFAMAPWNQDFQTKRLSRLFSFGSVPTVESYTLALESPPLPPASSVVEEDTEAATKDRRVWHWEFKELSGPRPMTAEGVLYTRPSDGMPVRVHIVANDAPMPGSPDIATLTFDLITKSI
jgi:hypothetical protein